MGRYVEELRRSEEFNAKLVALVEEYRDTVGPSIDPVTEKACEHDKGEDCACSVPDDMLMIEWVFLAQWQQFGTDSSWSSCRFAPHMIRSHKVGLLKTHMDDL